MNEMDRDRLATWCAERRIIVSNPSLIHYQGGTECSYYTTRLPESYDGRVAISRAVLAPVDSFQFAGAVVWLSSWGMGDDVVGPTLYEQLRLSYGLRSTLTGDSAISFDASEANQCLTFLALFAIVGWDAFFIPDGGEFFSFFSNDGFVDTVVRERSLETSLLNVFRPWETAPIDPARNRYLPRN